MLCDTNQTMWQCETCNEWHADQFDSCWNCAGSCNAQTLTQVYERRHFLAIAKVLAILVSAFWMVIFALGPAQTWLNGFTFLLLAALFCLRSSVHWLAPCTILGFCTAHFFAVRVNGTGWDGIIIPLYGAVFGFVFGLLMEFVPFNRRTPEAG